MKEFFEFLDENLDSRSVLEQEAAPSAFDAPRHAEEKESAAEGCDLEVLGKCTLDPDGRMQRRIA